MPPLESMLLAAAIVTAAAALQASIGFGLALVAAPLLVLIDRTYVPGPLIGAGLLLGLLMAWRERGEIDTSGVRVAAFGRIVGVIPAGYALSVATQDAFDLLFASLVLAAVGLSMLHRGVTPTPRAVFGASVVSGIMGTITSIGGPPMALVYQSSSGAVLRATLALIFVFGSVISLVALAVIGRFGATEIVYSLTLLPGIVAGILISGPLLHVFDRGATRPLVLALSAISACVVLLRALR